MQEGLIIKRGDTRPISGKVADSANPVPFQGISTLLLFVREVGETQNFVDGFPLEVVSEQGEWSWSPLANQVNQVGKYDFYLLATYSDATQARFPNAGFIRLQIGETFED